MRAWTALYVALTAALLGPEPTGAEHWAVIVAGSNGYSNYRHQADACHAYHVVRRHGIPEENVVLMMYDDVAADKRNPFPGKLFNKPAAANATHAAEPVDVYTGCNIDYRGVEVTPEAFINVMLGNSSANEGKKVLNSTMQDRVFINFVDHGSRGNVYFPNMKPLTAHRLATTMTAMHDQKMYKELVFYMEACESGSMFSSSFLRGINAFVTTAASAWESSWGTYCPPFDMVDGVALGTCLGDLYSVNWMQDSDLTDLSDESLKNQFLRVKNATSKSHVHSFGSTRISKEIVGNFQSTYDKRSDDSEAQSGSQAEEEIVSTTTTSPSRVDSAVDAHDVDLVLSFYRYLRATPGEERRELAATLTEVIRAREASDEVFERIHALYEVQTKQPLQQVPHPERVGCHEQVQRVFRSTCGTLAGEEVTGFSSYSLKYAGTLLDLCESGLPSATVLSIVRAACSTRPQLSSSLPAPDRSVYNGDVAMLG